MKRWMVFAPRITSFTSPKFSTGAVQKLGSFHPGQGNGYGALSFSVSYPCFSIRLAH